jgi:hypothetical protein
MADDPKSYGPIVHAQRLAHEADQAALEGRQRFALGTWEERTPAQREMDERIGAAVAVRATRDARLELDELRAEVMRYRAALPACLGALRARLAVSPHGSDAKPYREALMALRGSEDQERTNEKGPDRA